MLRFPRLALVLGALLALVAAAPAFARDPAPTPPMGWNSWDAYGLTLNEAQFRANAAVLADLAPYGWTYAVIDEGWYMTDPLAKDLATRKYVMDGHGRLLPVPTPDRYPSAAGGAGFKPLADLAHAQGLKFGIHIVHGIPREAVKANLPIAGSHFRAADAAETSDVCPWDDGNYGIRPNAAGQAYYDSLIKLYAKWGVDFLKVDCIGDHPYRPAEIHQIARAIRRAGRPMVLSISPGPARVENLGELRRDANLWRVAEDLWDGWSFHADKPGDWAPSGLESAFDNLAKWSPYVRPGGWADADMMPLGSLEDHPGWGDPRRSRLTPDEQRTLVSLWAIARTPMILGADLTRADPALRALLTNREVIALDQRAGTSRPLTALPPGLDGFRVWVSTPAGAGGPDTVAIFNMGAAPASLRARWRDLGFAAGDHGARNLWDRDLLAPADAVELKLPAHGVAVLRVQ